MNTAASPVRACNSATVPATCARFALYQGPVPIRSRALVGRLAFDASRSTLRYARHVRAPCPAAAASRWHVASAPPRPPRSPVTLVALLTKKLILGPDGAIGELSLLHAAAMTMARRIT